MVYNAGRSLHAKVSSIISNGLWRWPRARNRVIQTIIGQTPATLLLECDVEDSVIWLTSSNGEYYAQSAWEAIRSKFPVQMWTNVIWFKKNVPRWAFIFWLAFQQRLSTNDRLASWGITVDVTCSLCGLANEYHQHLFFYCPFFQNCMARSLEKVF